MTDSDVLLQSLAVTLVIGLLVTWLSAKALLRSHARDIQSFWYFFSLGIVVSALITIWAVSSGAADDSGYHGRAGEWVRAALEATLNYEDEMTLLGAFACIVVLPQLLSYIFSAIFGCAAVPSFIKTTVAFLVWSAVKFLAVFAAVALTLAIVGPFSFYKHGWRVWPESIRLALECISAAFAILFFYRRGPEGISWLAANFPKAVAERLSRTHEWATRNLRPRGADALIQPRRSWGIVPFRLRISRRYVVGSIGLLALLFILAAAGILWPVAADSRSSFIGIRLFEPESPGTADTAAVENGLPILESKSLTAAVDTYVDAGLGSAVQLPSLARATGYSEIRVALGKPRHAYQMHIDFESNRRISEVYCPGYGDPYGSVISQNRPLGAPKAPAETKLWGTQILVHRNKEDEAIRCLVTYETSLLARKSLSTAEWRQAVKFEVWAPTSSERTVVATNNVVLPATLENVRAAGPNAEVIEATDGGTGSARYVVSSSASSPLSSVSSIVVARGNSDRKDLYNAIALACAAMIGAFAGFSVWQRVPRARGGEEGPCA